MKIPTKAAALSLPMISLCFLTKLALWSLFDDGFTFIQSLKQVLHHINLVFHKIYIPLMSKMSSVIHLFLSFILISHFRFVFPTICHNCRTWRLSCRVALLPCYPESAPRANSHTVTTGASKMCVFAIFNSITMTDWHTDGWTNGQINRQTEKASCRVACPYLRTWMCH